MSQPISAIASLAELLVSEWQAMPDHSRLDLVRKIESNARRTTETLTDLLPLFEEGPLPPHGPVPVAEVLAQVVGKLAPSAQIRAAVPADLKVGMARGQLRQVLGILLTNAIRHGRPPVEVSAEREDGHAVIQVCDRGPGVPAEQVAQLFTGLGQGHGLAIARMLVERNNGTIWYETADPHGARIRFRVP